MKCGTRASAVLAAACALAGVARGAPSTALPAHERAERVAAAARDLAARDPAACLVEARRALGITADFVPTEFVRAGRKGEVLEDEYLAAREAYRRHRAVLYRTMGDCLAAAGRNRAAVRHLRRAQRLDPEGGAVTPLAAALLAAGQPWEALRLLLGAGRDALTPAALALAGRAADEAGLPSLQMELDRAAIEALPAEPRPAFREGPLAAPERARLSTGEPLRFDDGELPLALYLSEVSCRTCSADQEALQRVAAGRARLLVAGEDPADDRALRQVLRLYGRDWPVVVGPRLAEAFALRPPALLVVARGGWSGAVVAPPFERSLPPVLEIFSTAAVRETRPRPAWDRRPVRRPEPVPQPVLLPEGLAPGEDEPAPERFEAAVRAYRAGRFAEALRLFDALAGAGDGWLLPGEARLNRALCLRRLGRADEARRLLLGTGDSRFQEAVDRALEQP